MKKNKGYTLVETIITLSIVSIVLVLITSVIIAISNITKRQDYESLCQSEYGIASKNLDSFFSNYSINGYSILQAENNILVITDGENNYSLNYNTNKKELSFSLLNFNTNLTEIKKNKFENLININFVAQDNLVTCTYEFLNFHSYTELKKLGVY